MSKLETNEFDNNTLQFSNMNYDTNLRFKNKLIEKKIQNQLSRIGWTSDHFDALNYLESHGSQSISQLADSLQLSRLKVYGIINSLQSLGLVHSAITIPSTFSVSDLKK